jgi:hypothetical protein
MQLPNWFASLAIFSEQLPDSENAEAKLIWHTYQFSQTIIRFLNAATRLIWHSYQIILINYQNLKCGYQVDLT